MHAHETRENPKMKKLNQHAVFAKSLICMAVAAAWLPAAWAQETEELDFSYAPASDTHRPPIPNVIISVDDSGSMAWRTQSDSNPKTGEKSRMKILKEALADTLSVTNVSTGSIRLAWQSLNRCTDIPSNSGGCGNNNGMKVLDEAHRKNFLNWVASSDLKASGSTPSHNMLYKAGEYLKSAAGINNPWASKPGETELPYLGCRRSYNVFLSDGGWNLQSEWFKSTNLATMIAIGNHDGSNKTFPDLTAYNASSAQTKIYSDGYGTVVPTFSYNGNKEIFTEWSSNSNIAKPDGVKEREAKSDGYGGLFKCEKESELTGWGWNQTWQYRWVCKARDSEPSSYTNYPTLSDLAFYYWSADLQPHIKTRNDGEYTLEPQIRHKGSEVISSKFSAEEYWNPKNNPAIWPHMNMFTVAFGPAASLSSPKFGANTWDLESGDYKNLLTGDKVWANPITSNDASDDRRAELWHAAINSRGTFVPVTEAEDLVTAFKTILNQIIADNTQPMTSVTLTASTLRRDSNMYVSSYNPANWTGEVTAYAVAADTGEVDPDGAWGTTADNKPVTTASLLSTARGTNSTTQTSFASARKVFSSNGTKGVTFQWNQLTTAQQTSLKNQDTLTYLRGGPDGSRRQRSSIHGDIVNSKTWYYNGDAAYLKKTGKETDSENQRKALYTGANDGMLHAFNANTGAELFAYVPLGAYANLASLADVGYTHKYFVDGSPFVSEVNTGTDKSPVWKDYLVGTLGAGGKGYFILDVTNPASFAASDVKLDATATTDADIGHIFGEPTTDQTSTTRATQLTKLNDGKWAFVTGNGYNSTNQNSVLVIQYLDGTLKKLTANLANSTKTKVAGNGLSSPRLVDLSGDGVPDIAYAGDLSGNLWKFDISGKKPADWGVALGGYPLFQTQDNQPITVAPSFIKHSNAPGLMVIFGTGQNLTDEDRATEYVQTLYGIHDRVQWSVTEAGDLEWKTEEDEYLPEQYPITLDELAELSLTTLETEPWSGTVEDAKVNYYKEEEGGNFFKGWYLDLAIDGSDELDGSRVLGNIDYIVGNWFRVNFTVPAKGGAGGTAEETCEPVYSDKKDFVGIFSAVTGKAYPRDGGGFYTDPSGGLSAYLANEGGQTSITPPGIEKDENFEILGSFGLTPTWRQVQ